MKVSNPRLVRIGGLVKGAIVEPGDGTLDVSPSSSQIVELPSPIDKCLVAPVGSAAIPWDDTVLTSAVESHTGALAQGNQNIIFFSKGAWKLYISSSFFFTGTTNTGVNSSLLLIDPDAVGVALYGWGHITGAQNSFDKVLPVVFQRDGWSLQLKTGATVAADNVWNYATVLASRVL